MRLLFTFLFAGLFLGSVAGQTGPAPDAVKQVETRRKLLEKMGVWFSRAGAPLKDAELSIALKQLDEALGSRDVHVYYEAVRDLTNGNYQEFPPDVILKLLVPRFKTPETVGDRMTAQGFLMENLARRFGSKAGEALPDLLRMVTDASLPTYLRGQAVDAAARIGPGDATLIAAFIEALGQPETPNSSGVHGRAAEKLGDMGRAAWPAKTALRKLFERGPSYEDFAFVALGKLALDENPRPLGDYLDLLVNLDEIPTEQAAAAYIHVQWLCAPGTTLRPSLMAAYLPSQVDLKRDLAKVDRKLAERARSPLLKIVEQRTDNDIHVRTALRTLVAIGPGSSAEAARVLVSVLTRKRGAKVQDAREDCRAVLAFFEPGDKMAVPALADGLDRIARSDHRDRLSCQTLAEVVGRYGKDAAPAAPALMHALEQFKMPPPYPSYEELGACADALAAGGGDVPGARALLLQLLDDNAPLLKKAGPAAPGVQARLLLAIGKMRLPTPGEEREAALDRIRGGLSSSYDYVFLAGAKVVATNGLSFAAKEADTLVPLLLRVFGDKIEFKPHTAGSSVPLDFTYDESMIGAKGLASRALAALGPAAHMALPELQALAQRPLVNVAGTYLPEPSINHAIREARKAVRAIRP